MWSRGHSRAAALRWRGEVVTYGELAIRVGMLAARLRDREGVISAQCRNDLASVVLLLAALEVGKPIALLPEGTPQEIASWRRLLGRAVEIDAHGEVVWEALDEPVLHHPEAALIAFTSGSTGHPRAVQISRRHMERNAANCIEMIGMGEVDCQTLFAPISHLFALFGHLLPGLRAGIETQLMNGVAEARMAIMRREVRGILSGVPAHWEALLRHAPKDMDQLTLVSRIVSSGAPLGRDLRRRLAEAFSSAVILNGYGLSESPRILALSSRHPSFFSDATGFPTSGTELDLTEEGELRVRGELVMLGYIGPAEWTSDRIRGGWLHTGDAAQRDQDGLFTVIGRRDEVRKIGAERVSLVEVDQELMRLTGVEDAAAAVVADELYGERLIAFLCGSGLASASRNMLRDAMARRISWQKVPTRMFLVAALPRNRAGKIQRGSLLTLLDGAREL